MRLLIQNAIVIDPSQHIHEICDLLAEDGKIAAIAPQVPRRADQIVDGTGLILMPGLVDLHVHLRDPGFTQKEDILSGTSAAVAGGVTSMLCMPNTKPCIQSKETVDYINHAHKKAKVYLTGAITKDMAGEALNDFASYREWGVKAVSDDGKPVENAKLMQQALLMADREGLFVTSHCEDLKLIDGGIINDGAVSRMLGVKGMSRVSEDYQTEREIALAEETGTAVHIAHVSTAKSADAVRRAKRRGVKVTAETAPHYFIYTEQKLLSQDADYRMNPPLRTEEDRKAILDAVLDGTFDCIVTDHAPHTPQEKADFFHAPNGVIGMETSFAAAYTALVKPGYLTIDRLIALMSCNPAKLLGIEAGSLKVGMPADFVLLDCSENASWTVDVNKLHGKSRNCVFKGEQLACKVVMTVVDGEVVYQQSAGGLQ
jgi:dihydroorotase